MLKRKVDKGGKHHSELVEAGKDAAEEALDFIASAILRDPISKDNTIGVGWHPPRYSPVSGPNAGFHRSRKSTHDP